MGRVETMVQLSEKLVELLDRKAARRRISRSALIRGTLEAVLVDDREAAVARRIVEGHERIPSATPDEWDELATLTGTGSVDLLQRLDVEEREAGHSPW